MLVELRDVEVFIEPRDILTQAIEEGDVSVDSIIYECITEAGVEQVLDGVDNDDICAYVEKYKLDLDINTLPQITTAIRKLSQADKSQILWQLLKCEEQ